MDLKLGKKPHVEDGRDLMLANYLDTTTLPTPPDEFTFADVVENGEWGTLLNDSLGDCAAAMALHSQLVLGRLGDHHPEFNDACAERAYEEMGGYVPGDPSTDQGCDMREVAKVWQKQGVVDVNGHRHKTGLYVWLEPGNIQELWLATHIFKAGMIGYRLTQSAMDAFRAAHDQNVEPVWEWDPGSPEIGGHAVPEFGPQEGFADSVSWGSRVKVSPGYIENQMDSGFIVVSSSIFDGSGQLEGFDHERLVADAKQLEVAFA